MIERSRELVLGVVVVAVLAAGLVYQAAGGGDTRRYEPGAVPGPRFHERALYCPPTSRGLTTHLAVGAISNRRVSVGFEPSSIKRTVLHGKSMIWRSFHRGGAFDVVGYGAPVAAAALGVISKPVPGADAQLCSPKAAPRWYFAQGSSAFGSNERVFLYNPFPDEAVVSLRFLTPKGPRTKAGLSDLAVPSGGSRIVRINKYILKEPVLALEADAVRGRIVAWQSLVRSSKHSPGGLELSLGADRTSPTWYFPAGAVGPSFRESIAIANPGAERATATVSLATNKSNVQPPRLVDVSVPGGSAKRIHLSRFTSGAGRALGGTSVTVTATKGSVVAARSISVTKPSSGVAATTGLTSSATHWALGAPAAAASSDLITVLNPGNAGARVSVALESAGHPAIRPAKLAHIKVPARLRVRIPVTGATKGKPMFAILRSDRPVVAERTAYPKGVKDVAVLSGAPLSGPRQ